VVTMNIYDMELSQLCNGKRDDIDHQRWGQALVRKTMSNDPSFMTVSELC